MGRLRKYAESIQSRITDAEEWLVKRKLAATAFFCLFSLALFIVCFLGQKPVVPTVQVGQVARHSIISEINFSYESKIAEKQRSDYISRSIPPVYFIDKEQAIPFEEKVFGLKKIVSEDGLIPNDLPFGLKRSDIETLRQTNDIYLILEKALICYQNIFNNGIIRKEEDTNKKLILIFLERKNKSNTQKKDPATEFEANREFIEYMRPDFGDNLDAAAIIGKIFSQGLKTNLVYDKEATEALIEKQKKEIVLDKVLVKVGDEIVRRGDKVTEETIEKINQYRKEIIGSQGIWDLLTNSSSIRKILFTCVTVFLAGFFAKAASPELLRRIRPATVFCTVTTLDLIFVRFRFEILQSPWGLERYELLSSVLPYFMPQAFAALLLTTLCGPSLGILAALIVSSFSTMIFGGNPEMLFTFLLPSFIGIILYQRAQFRSNFIRAALIVGCIQAVCIIIFGFLNKIPFSTLQWPTLTALASGICTGIIIIGLLPVLESIFAQTSDVRLQELSNYNHPLLRRMQLEAPGTYHHSLMVANLSEYAAIAVDANPLICRVTSLFHDIGKLECPEYFVENQVAKGIENPHLKTKPSMSALIIRRHVKDGVILAKKNKLPRIIIDIIKQHHGTSIIKYFYVEALKLDKGKQLPLFESSIHRHCEVEESTYRYDGPKPQFLESTIVFFADAVEAATRSLQKINHHTVEELIERIFNDRIADNQLTDSSITFEQLNKIKESFIKTILTANHSRIEYPQMPGSQKNATTDEKKTTADKTTHVQKHNETHPAV